MHGLCKRFVQENLLIGDADSRVFVCTWFYVKQCFSAWPYKKIITQVIKVSVILKEWRPSGRWGVRGNTSVNVSDRTTV